MASRLNENTVFYKLFPLLNEYSMNSDLSKKDILEIKAENYITKINGFLYRYIWQNDSFNLQVRESMQGVPDHLEGITCFEDNIEDEWFIVYLLFYLTEKDSDLVVQVEDNDGEFLLIESAEYLPKWLNPDTSENRVFIFQGSLHIIPIAKNPSEITPVPSGVPSISDSINAIRHFSSTTKASTLIQQAIQKRIQVYPHRIEEFKHRTHCYLPASLIAIMNEDPTLLPHAVKAFYHRDALDLKACQAMKYFAPETRLMTEVVFTRCLYAQLSSQHYEPDKRIGWNLPNVNHPDRKFHELGIKLACGFEILAANTDKLMTTENDVSYHDFNNDVRWKRFMKSLQDKGYFQGEIEGSKLYKTLLSQAKEFYLLSLKRDTNANLSPGLRVHKLLSSISFNYEELKEQETSLRPPDDDNWMEITSENLDSLLDQMSQENGTKIANTITAGLKSFVHHISDLEGAEMPKNLKNKKQKINFDADAFTDAVNTILDFRLPGSDDECSSSSMSSYSDDEGDEINLGEEKYDKNYKTPIDEINELEDMKIYMDQMDRELAKTDVGLSFEKISKKNELKPNNQVSKSDNLADIDDEKDDFCPVDIDLTALKNILESYSNQQGLPGPASNLFSSMNLSLPDDADI